MPTLEKVRDTEITEPEYELVRKLIYERAGINLGSNRQHLVQARLAKRIRTGEFSGFREYFKYLESENSGDEISHLIDAISTNTTSFFREPDHFHFLTESISQRCEQEGWRGKGYMLRVWSAASSTGEEPYTLATVIHQFLGNCPSIDFKLLATDISQKVLKIARQACYGPEKIKSIPPDFRRLYLRTVYDEKTGEPLYEFVPEIRRLVTFSYFNLIDSAYPFKYGFDYIFCRNVMIYFDRPTQEGVIHRMTQHLRPGGHLIVGHSESLNGLKHDLQYVKPTIYRRK